MPAPASPTPSPTSLSLPPAGSPVTVSTISVIPDSSPYQTDLLQCSMPSLSALIVTHVLYAAAVISASIVASDSTALQAITSLGFIFEGENEAPSASRRSSPGLPMKLPRPRSLGLLLAKLPQPPGLSPLLSSQQSSLGLPVKHPRPPGLAPSVSSQ